MIPGPLRRLATPSLAAIADQGVVSIANFLTGVILARGLTQEQFGVYALGLSIVLVGLDLQTTLTTTPYMVFGPQLSGRLRGSYLGSTVSHQLGLSGLLALGLIGAGLVVQSTGDETGMGMPLVALGLVVVLVLFRDFARKISFADQEPRSALLLDTAATLLQLGGILLLLWSDVLTVSTAFLAIGISTGLPSGIWIWARRDRIKITTAASVEDAGKNWRFGKWVLMSGALWSLSLNTYPWLLASAGGTAATAIWAVGLGVVSVANPLKLGYQNHLGPEIANRFAAGGENGVRQAVVRGSWRFAGIIAPVVLALFLIGDQAAELIYGSDYSGLGLLVGILALDLLVSAVAFAFSRGLFVMNRADMDLKVNVAAVGVLLLAGIWLAWWLGPVGAACGLLLANTVATALRIRVFWRLTEVTH